MHLLTATILGGPTALIKPIITIPKKIKMKQKDKIKMHRGNSQIFGTISITLIRLASKEPSMKYQEIQRRLNFLCCALPPLNSTNLQNQASYVPISRNAGL